MKTPFRFLSVVAATVTIALVVLPARARAQDALPTIAYLDSGTAGNARFDGVSPDGMRVFFESQESITADDTDGGLRDLFMFDLSNAQVTRLSPGNGPYTVQDGGVRVSGDGNHVVFMTDEPIAAGDTNTSYDLYEYTVGGGVTWISQPTSVIGCACDLKGISASGSRVFFMTNQNLDPSDTDAGTQYDAYYVDVGGGTPVLISPGGQNANQVTIVHNSADGTKALLYTKESYDAGDTNGVEDLYQWSGGTPTWISQGEVTQVHLPDYVLDDESRVFFKSDDQLDPVNDTDTATDEYLWTGGAPILVSGTGAWPPYDLQSALQITPDGTHYFFETLDPLVAADQNSSYDTYEWSNGSVALVTSGHAGSTGAYFDAATPDASTLFIDTNEALVPADTDTANDTYELTGGTATLLTPGTTNSDSGQFQSATPDGSRLFFDTTAALLPSDTHVGVDEYEWAAGQLYLLTTGVGGSNQPTAISKDGRTLVWNTTDQFDPRDTDSTQDIYVLRLDALPAPSGGGGGGGGGTTTTDTTTTPTSTTTSSPPPSAAPTAGPPPPVLAKTFNVQPISGTVLVQLPTSKTFVPLETIRQIPNGSIVDARKGRVRLYASDGKGGVQFADFFEGVFKLTQAKNGLVVLTLVGGDFSKCPRRAAVHAAIGKSIRHLWGQGNGKFRTVGRFASATLRGTTWDTDDRCDGTLIKVTRGVVGVRDIPKRKTVVLKAPKKYFAKAG